MNSITSPNEPMVISKETIHRLLADVKYIYKNPLIQSENVFKYDSVNIASYDYYVLNKPGTRYIDDILGGQLTNEAEMPGPFSIPRINGGKKSKRRHNRKSKRH